MGIGGPGYWARRDSGFGRRVSDIGPVECVELSEGVLKGEAEWRNRRNTGLDRVGDLRLLKLEAFWEDDSRPVRLTGRRTADRFDASVREVSDPNFRPTCLTIVFERDSSRSCWQAMRTNRREDLEVRPSMLCTLQGIDRGPLLVSHRVVENQLSGATALINGPREVHEARKARPAKRRVAEMPLGNVEHGETVALTGGGPGFKLARAAPIAIAASDLFAADTPIDGGARSRICLSGRSLQPMSRGAVCRAYCASTMSESS